MTLFNTTVTDLRDKIDAGDTALQAQLNTEQQERMAADQNHDLKEAELDVAIDAEVDARQQGDLRFRILLIQVILRFRHNSKARPLKGRQLTRHPKSVDSFFDVFTQVNGLFGVDSFFDVFVNINNRLLDLQNQINNIQLTRDPRARRGQRRYWRTGYTGRTGFRDFRVRKEIKVSLENGAHRR